jgi:hypothetical protein
MGVFWKAKTALISAAKGWACVWILILLWHMVSLLRVKSNISFTDLAGIALLWIVSTGVVTLGATVLFIVPYVCLVRADKLLAKPWRLYLESSAITTLVTLGLNYRIKPYAYTFWQNLPPYLTFALAVSLISSAFFMQALIRHRSLNSQL